jgi:hypothetical protein
MEFSFSFLVLLEACTRQVKGNFCSTKRHIIKKWGGMEVPLHIVTFLRCREVTGQFQVPAALSPEKELRYPGTTAHTDTLFSVFGFDLLS